jgi:hypothetical protein
MALNQLSTFVNFYSHCTYGDYLVSVFGFWWLGRAFFALSRASLQIWLIWFCMPLKPIRFKYC